MVCDYLISLYINKSNSIRSWKLIINIQMAQKQFFKKQGLLLLIDKYINQPTTSLLPFLRQNVPSTPDLAASLQSHWENGLSSQQLTINQNRYGRNTKIEKDSTKWSYLYKISSDELFRIRTGLILLLVLFEIICGNVWQVNEMKLSSVTVLVAVVFSWIIKIGVRLREKIVLEDRQNSRDSTRYFVYRNGERTKVLESQIVVGDLLCIDSVEGIPVSGLLITGDASIDMDESIYGKGIQPKLPLQLCISYMQKKSELQLRIDYQSGLLPSPLIMRGSVCTTTNFFKMLVLCTEEVSILEKKHLQADRGEGLSSIEAWINSTTRLMQKIGTGIIIFVLIFHVLAFIFKIKGLPPNHLLPLAQTILQTCQTLLCIFLFVDSSLIKDVLRGAYLKVANLLGNRKEIDNLLAVEQIFLTEESVCKYDKIVLKKVALADVRQPIDINLLPALKPEQIYSLLYEIIAGVGLDKGLTTPKQLKNHRNSIAHLINFQQRIFSSLYAAEKKSSQGNVNENVEMDSINELIKSQNKFVHENINRILPKIQMKNQKKGNLPHIFVKKHEDRKTEFERQQGFNRMQQQEEKRSSLDQYLTRLCHFSTQNVVEGLQKLAKNMSRTYYFQKCTFQRLQDIQYYWFQNRFTAKNPQLQVIMEQNIVKIQKAGLIPYFIGFDEGVFLKNNVNFLLGIVGVQISFDEEISNKISQLQQIGINTLLMLSQSEDLQITSNQRKEVEQELLKRKYISIKEQITDMKTICSKGGRVICSVCLTTICKCRIKNEQLANPQGFLDSVSGKRCIQSAQEEDRKYLFLGFQQLNISTLQINGRESDTKGKLDHILAGHQLFNALEENVVLWISWLATVALCLFPCNFLTFNNVLSYSQLFMMLFYMQILMLRHQFAGSSSLFTLPTSNRSNRKKQKMGLALKIDILLFVILVAGGVYIILSNPQMFSGPEPVSGIDNYNCSLMQSYYHNPKIAKAICQNQSQKIILYSKAETFIFLYLLLTFTFRSGIIVDRPFSKENILFHGVLITFLLVAISFCSRQLQLTTLSILQLGICMASALGIVFVSFFCRWLVLVFKKSQSFQFQLYLGAPGNQFSQLLKQFKQKKTLQFSFEKEQLPFEGSQSK